jgi:uncharacterized protein YeaO (DUF488 family)
MPKNKLNLWGSSHLIQNTLFPGRGEGNMSTRIKRVFETPAKGDGRRILVDRLWPRGISREKGKIDLWFKELAPSTDLRKWYDHDPEKWLEFKSRYFAELDANLDKVRELLTYVRRETVTFLFSSKELNLNNAFALKEYLESRKER